jgi:hypothetical protein
MEDHMPNRDTNPTNHDSLAARRLARRVPVDDTATNVLYVAVVHAADGVRHTAVAGTRRDLIARIAEYVRQRGDHALRDDHVRHLRGLLVRRELEAAVELYFGLVGERWDEEWLVTAVVDRDSFGAAAVVGEVALADALIDRPQLRDAS